MHKKKSILERLDLTDEALPGECLVELYGTKRVLIEYHCGIVRYGPEEICVRTHCGFVRILGETLVFCRLSGRQLVISGKIRQLLLEEHL